MDAASAIPSKKRKRSEPTDEGVKVKKPKAEKKKKSKRSTDDGNGIVPEAETLSSVVVSEAAEPEVPKKKSKKHKRDVDAPTEATQRENGQQAGETELKKPKKTRKDNSNAAESTAPAGDSPAAVAPNGVEVKKSRKSKNKTGSGEKSAEMDVEEPAKKSKAPKETEDHPMADVNGNAPQKKAKKDKKNKKNKAQTPVEVAEEAIEVNGGAGGDSVPEKAARHIVFVGNLPYSATEASIRTHFASLKPISVRALTKKDDPTKSRGIAFIEFENAAHMRTCLDKLHHSTFDDGISPARKINVELTAGGGGKKSFRMEKIKEKNHKLNENRFNKIAKEQEAKEKKKLAGDQAEEEPQQDYMHPSRRAMVSRR